MKIYFAGPDIFRPDVAQWAIETRALCERFGHTALLPTDCAETEPGAIFRANIASIQAAELVLANLNPFRGVEPDSGTCVEVGYGLALGKRVLGYVSSTASTVERVIGWQGAPATRRGGRITDRAGFAIEDFGLPLNLMLAIPVPLVAGGIAECLAHLRTNTCPTDEPTSVNTGNNA
ncbi:MAG: nucleoside 2-deoxyribosyltransferase [Betaproteobacteria bacterium]|nr:nucleoside 2-deoxyribosyltransferase [Betaproteobacteria bacterium]